MLRYGSMAPRSLRDIVTDYGALLDIRSRLGPPPPQAVAAHEPQQRRAAAAATAAAAPLQAEAAALLPATAVAARAVAGSAARVRPLTVPPRHPDFTCIVCVPPGGAGGADAAVPAGSEDGSDDQDSAYDNCSSSSLPTAADDLSDDVADAEEGHAVAGLAALTGGGCRSTATALELLDDVLVARYSRAVSAGVDLLCGFVGRGLPAASTWLLTALVSELPAGGVLRRCAASAGGVPLLTLAVLSGCTAMLEAALAWPTGSVQLLPPWDMTVVAPGLPMTPLQTAALLSATDGGAAALLLLQAQPHVLPGLWFSAAGPASRSPEDMAGDVGGPAGLSAIAQELLLLQARCFDNGLEDGAPTAAEGAAAAAADPTQPEPAPSEVVKAPPSPPYPTSVGKPDRRVQDDASSSGGGGGNRSSSVAALVVPPPPRPPFAASRQVAAADLLPRLHPLTCEFVDPALEAEFGADRQAGLLRTDRLHTAVSLMLALLLHALHQGKFRGCAALVLDASTALQTAAVFLLPPATYLRCRVPLGCALRAVGYTALSFAVGEWVETMAPLAPWHLPGGLLGSSVEGLRVTMGHVLPLRAHLPLHGFSLMTMSLIGAHLCAGVVPGSASAAALQRLHTALGPLHTRLWQALHSLAARLLVALGAPAPVLPPLLQQQCLFLPTYMFALCFYVMPTLVLHRYEAASRRTWYSDERMRRRPSYSACLVDDAACVAAEA